MGSWHAKVSVVKGEGVCVCVCACVCACVRVLTERWSERRKGFCSFAEGRKGWSEFILARERERNLKQVRIKLE